MQQNTKNGEAPAIIKMADAFSDCLKKNEDKSLAERGNPG